MVAFECGGADILIATTNTRHGKKLVALVPLEDMELLEDLEDRIDLEEAKAQGPIPFDQAAAMAARVKAFRGKFAHLQPSADQFMRDKREELEREERNEAG